MEISQRQLDLIAAYLSDNISSNDKIELDEWISLSPANKQVLDEASLIWKKSGIKLSIADIDSVALFSRIMTRIQEEEKPIKKITPLFSSFSNLQKIAATLIIVCISYFIVWSLRKDVAIVSGNKVTTLYLPDSSKVWLNINSSLTYSRKFEERKVKLEGEGFFIVKKNRSDFTVEALNTQTQVLGTAFNIKSANDSSVTLTVAEGKVAFADIKHNKTNSAIVVANEKAVFSKGKSITKVKNNDLQFLQWRELNNPLFDREKENPEQYIAHQFSWKKNQLNQSVIEGTLQSNATLAAYSKISLIITYKKLNGGLTTTQVTLSETLYPGETLTYRKSLLDIFTASQAINVQAKSTEITTKQSY